MIFTVFLTSFLIFLLYFTFRFLLIPYKNYLAYKSKDITGCFFPFFGLIHFMRQSSKKDGDCFAYYKQLPKKKPDVRAQVSNFGHILIIELLDSKLIKEFYAQQHFYKKPPFIPTAKTLVGSGLLALEGQAWKQHRKLLSNMFHFEFLKENIPLMVKTAREFLDRLEQGPLDDVEIMNELQKITGEIVGRIFFGENLNKYTVNGQLLTIYLADLSANIFKNQRDAFTVILRVLNANLNLSPTFRRLKMQAKEFREVCFKIVSDRKASNIKSNDMLGLMLETQNNLNKEETFSDEDIVSEFITFFVGGMDTTGHLLTMVLYMLDKNPHYIGNLMSEVKNFYNRTDPVIYDSLNQMEFTHAFLKETLRFYTPAPGTFPRIAQEDHKLMNIQIKKGMGVRPNPLYNYFHPKYFEDPERFYPERWLNKSLSLDTYVYIPFSAGSRNCIGQHLSIMESKIILSEFLNRFDFEVNKNFKLRMTANLLYEPYDKLTLTLFPKSKGNKY